MVEEPSPDCLPYCVRAEALKRGEPSPCPGPVSYALSRGAPNLGPAKKLSPSVFGYVRPKVELRFGCIEPCAPAIKCVLARREGAFRTELCYTTSYSTSYSTSYCTASEPVSASSTSPALCFYLSTLSWRICMSNGVISSAMSDSADWQLFASSFGRVRGGVAGAWLASLSS